MTQQYYGNKVLVPRRNLHYRVSVTKYLLYFLSLCNTIEKWLWFQFVWPAVRVPTIVNIPGLPWNVCTLLTFTIAQLLLKMKYVAVIVLLQGQSKIFFYIAVNGKKIRFKCIYVTLHHFKHESVVNLKSSLKYALWRTWEARIFLFIHRAAKKNPVT